MEVCIVIPYINIYECLSIYIGVSIEQECYSCCQGGNTDGEGLDSESDKEEKQSENLVGNLIGSALPVIQASRKKRKTLKENLPLTNRHKGLSSKLAEQTPEPGALGSPGVPVTTLLTLRGFESKLSCAISAAVSSLRALHDTYDIEYPHPQLVLLFLPIGRSGLAIGNGVWDPGTCLRESIVNSSIGASYCVFGGLVVFDCSVLHTATENHPKVFQSQEIIVEVCVYNISLR